MLVTYYICKFYLCITYSVTFFTQAREAFMIFYQSISTEDLQNRFKNMYGNWLNPHYMFIDRLHSAKNKVVHCCSENIDLVRNILEHRGNDVIK